MDYCCHANTESMSVCQHCVTLLQEAALPAATLVPVPFVVLSPPIPPPIFIFIMFISCQPALKRTA